MAYFANKRDEEEQEPERLFVRPVQDDDDDDLADAYEDLPEGELQLSAREEEALRRRDNLKVAAGVGDFIGVVVGTLVILALLLLLFSLIEWTRNDMYSFFSKLIG